MSSRAELKSHFQTGDKPTQADFDDLIDSLALESERLAVDTKANTAIANAAAAQTTATTANNKGYRVLLRAFWNGSAWVKDAEVNVGTITIPDTAAGRVQVRVTFGASLGNANYVAIATLNYLSGNPGTFRHLNIENQTASYIDLAVSPRTGMVGPVLNNPTYINLMIFKP